MAGFEVIMYGRFWVTAEEIDGVPSERKEDGIRGLVIPSISVRGSGRIPDVLVMSPTRTENKTRPVHCFLQLPP